MAKLKTYTVAAGFYELAVAAPSMKAALAAWGLTHNAFHQGFAKQVTTPAIVAAAEAQPGTVLRRPIGGKGMFKAVPDAPKAPPPRKGAKPKAKKIDAKKLRAAERALEKQSAAHDRRVRALDAQQRKLAARTEAEEQAWQARREKLDALLARARKPR